MCIGYVGYIKRKISEDYCEPGYGNKGLYSQLTEGQRIMYNREDLTLEKLMEVFTDLFSHRPTKDLGNGLVKCGNIVCRRETLGQYVNNGEYISEEHKEHMVPLPKGTTS